MHEALERGFEVENLFQCIQRLRPRTSMGLVAMVSYSIVFRFGLTGFVARCAEAGFDGFIFPDLPVEESEDARAAARDAGMTCSLLIAPNTSSERAKRIASACSGFVYLLARVGITGERREAPEIAERVRELRDHDRMTTPIACGFGLGSAEAVRAVTQHADAAIVGSAIIKRIQRMNEEGAAREAIVEGVANFVRELAAGLASAGDE